MKMSELILAIGDDNVAFQNLDQCSTAMNYNEKLGTKITFGTEQPLSPLGTAKLGLVLWLDRDAVKAAIAKEQGASGEVAKCERCRLDGLFHIGPCTLTTTGKATTNKGTNNE